MASVKITVIGGASAYTAGLLESFVQMADDLAGSEIVLMDIDSQHLSIIERLGQRMIAANGANLRLKSTIDRQEAMRDADFVLIQFRIGGLPARHLDELIPLKYGIIGQETVGPGGMFMALRTIPVVLEIAREMEKLSPQGLLINYTNPTGIVSEALHRHANVKTLGLCDEIYGVKRILGQVMEVDPSRMTVYAYGLNHASWGEHIWIDGKEATSELKLRMSSVSEKEFPDSKSRSVIRLFKLYGLIANRYLRYYYFHDEMLQEALKAPRTRAEEIMDSLPEIFASYEEQSRRPLPQLTVRRGTGAHGDLAARVINAIANNRPEVFLINTVNGGAIPNLPFDGIVEVPALVSRQGFSPLVVGPLPNPVAGLIQNLKTYELEVVKAAVTGSRHQALKALLSNPLIHSASKAELLLDEMLRAHQEYLPQFAH